MTCNVLVLQAGKRNWLCREHVDVDVDWAAEEVCQVSGASLQDIRHFAIGKDWWLFSSFVLFWLFLSTILVIHSIIFSFVSFRCDRYETQWMVSFRSWTISTVNCPNICAWTNCLPWNQNLTQMLSMTAVPPSRSFRLKFDATCTRKWVASLFRVTEHFSRALSFRRRFHLALNAYYFSKQSFSICGFNLWSHLHSLFNTTSTR